MATNQHLSRAGISGDFAFRCPAESRAPRAAEESVCVSPLTIGPTLVGVAGGGDCGYGRAVVARINHLLGDRIGRGHNIVGFELPEATTSPRAGIMRSVDANVTVVSAGSC